MHTATRDLARDGRCYGIGASSAKSMRRPWVMAQAVALEPEDLDLALDAGVRVMEAVIGQGSPVVRSEADGAHAEPNECGLQPAPCQQFMVRCCRLQLVPGSDEPSIDPLGGVPLLPRGMLVVL